MSLDRRGFLRQLTANSMAIGVLRHSSEAGQSSAGDPVVYVLDGWHAGYFLTTRADTMAAFQKLADRLDRQPQARACLEIEGYMLERMLEGAKFDSEVPGAAYEAPQFLERLRRGVESGQIEIVSGTYTQPLWPAHDGEGWIRQFALGTRAVRNALGVEVRNYAVQEDCFISQLPQILNGFGMEGALLRVHWAPWGTTIPANLESMLWEGPDGSRIAAVPRYILDNPINLFSYLGVFDVAQAMKSGLSRLLMSNMPDFMDGYMPGGGSRSEGVFFWAGLGQEISAVSLRGRTVTYSGWLRSNAEAACLRLDIGVVDGSPNIEVYAPTDGQWHRVEAVYKVPVGADVLHPHVKMMGGQSEGWISGLSLRVAGDDTELLRNGSFAAGAVSPQDWGVWRANGIVAQASFDSPAPGVPGRSVRVQWSLGANRVSVTLREYMAIVGTPAKVVADPLKGVPERWAWGVLGGELEARCRSAQRLAEAAERALCLYDTADTSEVLNAWRLVLMANHHDALSCFPSKFGQWRKSMEYASHCREWTADAETRAASVLRSAFSVDGSAPASVTVFNPAVRSRSEIVVATWATAGLLPLQVYAQGGDAPLESETFSFGADDFGRPRGDLLAWPAGLPPLGCAGFEVREDPAGPSPQMVTPSSGIVLENDYYRVFVTPDQGIPAIFDKRQNRDLLGAPISLAGTFPQSGGDAQSLVTAVRGCQGSLLGVAEIDGRLANVPFRQRVSLRRGSPLVEFEIEADFGAGCFVGAYTDNTFPSTGYTSDFVDHGRKMRFTFPSLLPLERVWSDHSYDVAPATPGSNWAVSWLASEGRDGGLALMTDRSSAFVWNADTLELVLAYGGHFIFGPAAGIPVLGKQLWRFALTSYPGAWEESDLLPLVEAIDRRCILLPGRAGRSASSQLEVRGRVVVGAAYREGQSIFIRLFNPGSATQPATLDCPNLTSLWEVDLRGSRLRQLSGEAGPREIPVGPRRLMTLKLELSSPA
jgi:hypothetical protein